MTALETQYHQHQDHPDLSEFSVLHPTRRRHTHHNIAQRRHARRATAAASGRGAAGTEGAARRQTAGRGRRTKTKNQRCAESEV